MNRNTTGARVHYCGHDASFVADIREKDGVAVVIAATPDFEEHLTRPAGECDFHVSDFPEAIYWGKKRGVLVVPSAQLTEIKPGGEPRQ